MMVLQRFRNRLAAPIILAVVLAAVLVWFAIARVHPVAYLVHGMALAYVAVWWWRETRPD